jgi:MtN3 and saliva related transmembrane protein
MTELIGWTSSLILLATIIAQVRKQWKTESNEGVSKWLFAGQIGASVGFTAYSVLTGNTVFILTNAMLLVSSLVGFYIYLRNSRNEN